MAPKQQQQQASAEQLQAQPDTPPTPPRKLDYAPRGGRYLVNGKLVDANGQPVSAEPPAPASASNADQKAH